MKSEKLLDAIGMVGEDLILEAKAPRKRHLNWKQWTAMAACLVLVISVLAIAKPFQPDDPCVTGPVILQRDPITIPFTSPSDSTGIMDPTEPPTQPDPTASQDPTEPPIHQEPTEPTYDPGPIMQLSASPKNAYIGYSPNNPSKLAFEYAYDFIYVEARAVEILPDTYIEYADWSSSGFRIVRMQTKFSHDEMNVPKEFYLILDPKFMVDFLQYECLVLPYLYQCGLEDTILYNVTKESAEAFDLILFSAPHHRGGASIYAFTDGAFDESLWTINDVWADNTESSREHGTEFVTLEEIRSYFYERYSYGSSRVVRRSDITFAEGIAALEYVEPFDNGVFVQWNPYGVNESFSFQRFINGIPTNEYIYFSLNNETVLYSGTAFTQDDMDALPDIASAIITVEDAFQAGLIPPPHIVNYKDMELRRHGVTGWYFKANDKVYGVVQVNFTYYDDEKESRYDDIYFLIEPGSDTCVEICRDELLQLQGTKHFIYTHEYDENGKVPGDYIY